MSSYGNLYVKDLNVSNDIEVDTIRVDDKIEIVSGSLLTNNCTVFSLLKASNTLEVDSLLYFGNEVASQLVGNATNKTVGTNLDLTDSSNLFPGKYDQAIADLAALEARVDALEDPSGNKA
tara:strand:- start:284 stop:646 length:363 start_codon:yes stop_codon:yes gene_type:complete